MAINLLELAQRFGLKLLSEGQDLSQVKVTGVAAIDKAKAGDISYYFSQKFAHLLPTSDASVLIVKEPVEGFRGILLQHEAPQFVYAKLANEIYQIDHGRAGVDAGAFVDATAKLGEGVRVHRGAHIEAGVSLGARVVVYPGVYLGKNVTIGDDTVIYPNVVIYYGCIVGKRCIIHAGSVIGADGFGFSVHKGEITKIPQIGIVRIHDDVELGALCTIDRAANGETVIHRSVKFDDRVHVGHNCEIGENSMFSAQVGIAGSTKIGKWTLIGGQSGVADHLTLVDGVKIGAKTGVIQDIPEKGTYVGFPAAPFGDWRRTVVLQGRLREMDKTIRELKAKFLTPSAD